MKNRLDRIPSNTSIDFFLKIAFRPIRLSIFLLIFIVFVPWALLAPRCFPDASKCFLDSFPDADRDADTDTCTDDTGSDSDSNTESDSDLDSDSDSASD